MFRPDLHQLSEFCGIVLMESYNVVNDIMRIENVFGGKSTSGGDAR